MSTYTDFAPYLRPEHPKLTDTESQYGNEYLYRYPESAALTRPDVGDVWADGYKITDVKHTPSLSNSKAGGRDGLDELYVSTLFSRSTGNATTELIEEKYSMRPQASQVPLVQHPDFLPGGPSDLYTSTVSSGGYTEIPLWFVMHWENEPNPIVKSKRQFYVRDANGRWNGSSAAVSVPSGAATAYVKLRQLGYETKDVYNPVWIKISRYKGSATPVTASWGQYVAAASVPDLPSGVEVEYPDWIKTGDGLDPMGSGDEWQRTEEWTGYTKVYFDVDTLNPASHTIP